MHEVQKTRMTDFNQQQEDLMSNIREVIENHTMRDDSDLTREQVSDVLEHEAIQVEYGSQENYWHLDHLGKSVDKEERGRSHD